MLAFAAAINFSSIAVFIGARPASSRTTGAGRNFLLDAVRAGHRGILVRRRGFGPHGRQGRPRVAGASRHRDDVHGVAGARVPALHLGDIPILAQQVLLFIAGLGAQFAFPVLTLRMLDLFPAARGTAASAQSFVALLVTAFTLGIVSVKVLERLEWLAWASFVTPGWQRSAGTCRAARLAPLPSSAVRIAHRPIKALL
jgi:hypothetical protein